MRNPCRWVGVALVYAALPAAADRGMGRWSLGGYAEGYGVVQTDAASPRQRPAGILDLNLTGDTRAAHVYVDTRTIVGGTPEHAHGFGVANLSDTFQDISPSVEFEEGYVDVYDAVPHLDVRVGKQKITWGRLDTFHPTDVVDPRRYTDPFVMDENDAKIGLPAVRAAYFAPDRIGLTSETNLTLVWVPVPIPPRFPTEDERWFPPAAAVPPQITIPAGTLQKGLDADVTIHSTTHTENVTPPQHLDDGAVGLRLSALSGGADWSLCYYNGPETTPAFDLLTTVSSPAARRLLEEGRRPTVNDLVLLDGEATLRPRFERIQLVGGDLAFPLAGFTARAEAAYGMSRLLPRSTDELLSVDNIARSVRPHLGDIITALLKGQAAPIDLGDLFVRRDTVEWGAGVDYPYRGWVPVLQVNQTVILNNSLKLLAANVDTRLLGALRKTFLNERLATELVAFQGFERSYTSAIVRLTYSVTEHLRVRLGYLFVAGSRHTLFGQYASNDEIFAQVRYTR